MVELLGTVALEGGKKLAATFGGKLVTAAAGAGIAKAVNKGLDKRAEKKAVETGTEVKDSKYRKFGLECIGAAAGAVGFAILEETVISK